MRISSLLFAASAALCASVTSAQDRAVFLLDRSGSMTIGSPSRCDRSQAAAQVDIGKFFAAYPAAIVSVREFGGGLPGSSRALGPTEWMTSAATAQAAVGTASSCIGVTTLADALCDTSLALQVAASSSTCTIYVYTDGGENASLGACSGGTATNASTGCCSFDPYCNAPFATAFDGTLSWQQKTCTLMDALRQSCDTVVNLYQYGDFPLASIDPGFQFLQSLSRGTGGAALQIDDSVLVAPSIVTRRTDCQAVGRGGPILQFDGIPQLGNLFTTIHSAPLGYDRWIALSGFAYVPPLDLTVISAPGCALGIGPQFSINSALLPFIVPNNPSLVGETAHFQGLAFDVSLGLNPGWLLTTNTFSFTLVP